jgi:hypothetical protein
MQDRQLPSPRAWHTEGCDGNGRLLQGSGNIIRRGAGSPCCREGGWFLQGEHGDAGGVLPGRAVGFWGPMRWPAARLWDAKCGGVSSRERPGEARGEQQMGES